MSFIQNLNKSNGFTLIEVMIAISIFSIFAAVFVTGQGYNLLDSSKLKEEIILKDLCENKINDIIVNPPELRDSLTLTKETKDIEADHDAGEGSVEDRVVDLEDKLDELMAEFEALLGDEAGEEEHSDAEFDMEPVDGEVGGDAYVDDDTSEFQDMPMCENVSLAKVANPTHGDNGANSKSPVAANSGAAGMAAKPVRNTASEANPDGTSAYKAPISYADKGRGNLPGAGQFKNVPAKNGSKLEAAPKPSLAQATGVNTKTPFPKG